MNFLKKKKLVPVILLSMGVGITLFSFQNCSEFKAEEAPSAKTSVNQVHSPASAPAVSSLKCSAPSRSCQTETYIGRQTCSDGPNGPIYGVCDVDRCIAPFMYSYGHCVSPACSTGDTGACVSNGVAGVRTCENGTWGSCKWIKITVDEQPSVTLNQDLIYNLTIRASDPSVKVSETRLPVLRKVSGTCSSPSLLDPFLINNAPLKIGPNTLVYDAKIARTLGNCSWVATVYSNLPGAYSTLNITASKEIPSAPCLNGAANPPECTTLPLCTNGANNPPLCNTVAACKNGANNPPNCTTFSACTNGTINPPSCNVYPPCDNLASNPPKCTEFKPCSNRAINPPSCSQFPPCTNNMKNPPLCNSPNPSPPRDVYYASGGSGSAGSVGTIGLNSESYDGVFDQNTDTGGATALDGKADVCAITEIYGYVSKCYPGSNKAWPGSSYVDLGDGVHEACGAVGQEEKVKDLKNFVITEIYSQGVFSGTWKSTSWIEFNGQRSVQHDCGDSFCGRVDYPVNDPSGLTIKGGAEYVETWHGGYHHSEWNKEESHDDVKRPPQKTQDGYGGGQFWVCGYPNFCEKPKPSASFRCR